MIDWQVEDSLSFLRESLSDTYVDRRLDSGNRALTVDNTVKEMALHTQLHNLVFVSQSPSLLHAIGRLIRILLWVAAMEARNSATARARVFLIPAC